MLATGTTTTAHAKLIFQPAWVEEDSGELGHIDASIEWRARLKCGDGPADSRLAYIFMELSSLIDNYATGRHIGGIDGIYRRVEADDRSSPPSPTMQAAQRRRLMPHDKDNTA